MSRDHSPIPREAIPPGWGPVELHDERYVYRRSRPHVELIAVRASGDQSDPKLGISCSWELRYRLSVGDFTTIEQLGRVSTRHAALDGLVKCMERVHKLVDHPDDPIEVRTALESVPLANAIPDSAM